MLKKRKDLPFVKQKHIVLAQVFGWVYVTTKETNGDYFLPIPIFTGDSSQCI